MGDMGDYFNEMRADRKALREKYGVPCPKCREVRPKTNPSILLPAQRCKVDGYRDPRPWGEREEKILMGKPEIDKAEFIERFIARMVDRIGPTFDDGGSVSDYARQIATAAWDTDWQRNDGPEVCADVSIEYMCEG